MADPETIKKRRIIKSVRRKRTKVTMTPSTSADFPQTSNPFAGFSGLAKDEEEEKPKSNPFAGFSALTEQDNTIDDNTSNPFSVFSTMASSQENEKTPFPSSGDPVPVLSFEKKEEQHQEEEEEDSTFVKKRKGLNKSFYKWICKQFAENKFSDWTIGVQDYITHMKKLKQKRDKNTTTTNGTSSNAAPKIAKDTSDGGNDDDGDEKKVYEQRAKVFKLDTESKQYKQQGLGDLRIMMDKNTKKSRIVLYDACGRLMVNLNLYKGITFNREGKKAVAFVASTADEGPAKYMVRVKNTELADTLKESFEKYTN